MQAIVEPLNPLERARECYHGRQWAEAFQLLVRADGVQPLNADDLERLATSAYLCGRDAEYLAALERAQRANALAGECRRAARNAFWIGIELMFRGEMGAADGWLARAQRVLERETPDTVEHGYLLVAIAQRHVSCNEWELALAAAERAAVVGVRYDEADLMAVARHLQGRVLMRQRRVQEGIALLDEAMVAVTSGELSPIITGLIYCSVIDGCQEVCAYNRSCEWTSAYARWCDQQPELVAFTGVCLAHRSEILLLQGELQAAMDEAVRAAQRGTQAGSSRTAGVACYQQGEIHRMRGDLAAAEHAYLEASRHGVEPQPGLSLLRLAQGQAQAASIALHRMIATVPDTLQRARYLPAHIEVLLALGRIAEAAAACDDLDGLAVSGSSGPPGALDALAAQARGAVDLADNKPEAALVSLRRALPLWQQIDAPCAVARIRVLIALACRALGDEDACALELRAARATFEDLGAAPDSARVDALVSPQAATSCPLTPRELQVLRLVSAGKTNKAIAAELSLSERTVDRHLSKIFDKLDVPSRTAAAAYAFNHKLVCAH